MARGAHGNDYNATDRAEREKIHRLVGDLRGLGVAVAGIGLQGAWMGPRPRMSAPLHAALAVRLQVTEPHIPQHNPGAGATGTEPDPARLERQGAR